MYVGDDETHWLRESRDGGALTTRGELLVVPATSSACRSTAREMLEMSEQ